MVKVAKIPKVHNKTLKVDSGNNRSAWPKCLKVSYRIVKGVVLDA